MGPSTFGGAAEQAAGGAIPAAAPLSPGSGAAELGIPNDEDPTSVIVRYVRNAYWLTLGAMASLSLGEFFSGSPFLRLSLVIRGAALALGAVILRLGLRRTSSRSTVLATIAFGAVVMGSTVWLDAFTHDPFGSALAAVGLSLVAAWALPWSMPAQAALATLGGAAIIGAHGAAGLGAEMVVPLLLTAGSVPMTLLGRRQRSALAAARSAARQAGEQLHRIAENADEVLWILDLARSSIVYISPGVESLYGVSAAEIGTELGVLLRAIHPEDRDRVAAQIAAAGAMRAPARIDHRIRRPDGTVRWAQLRLAPIHNEAGTVVRVGGVIRDTTAEWELADAQRRAREEAEATARLKDQFIASMSHEIRTPLNGVIGMVDLLRESSLIPAQRAHVDTIHACGTQLLSLVNALLDFSKIEAGKIDVARVALDVGDLVAYVVRLFAARADEKGLDLSYRIALPPFAAFLGDPEILRQILTNLVDNAIKFTDKGHVVVRCSVAEAPDQQAVLCFEVEDTGVGVTPAAQAKIFESFIQADASTSRRFGGSGLGLAIARRLTRLMGGDIQVRSVVDSGSTFSFTTPVEPLVTDAADEQQLPRKRVLVAAASPESRACLIAELTAWGLRVTQVSSMETARAALGVAIQRGEPYDLLVADTDAWGMTPVAFLRALRQALPAVPLAIGFVAAGGQPGDSAAACEAGAAFFLHIPARPGRLFACLQMLWEPAARTGTTAAAAQSLGHILVVEDNLLNQRVAVAIIEWVGYRAEVVASGKEALEALEHQRFDAVIMDCQLPDMDGFETTARMRERERETGGRIPVIALTANATEAARQRCLAAGMDDFLTKPIQRRILSAVLARWINAPQPGGEAGSQPVDHARLQELTNGDPNELQRYTQMFSDEVDWGLREIRAGGQARVLAALHRMKGAAACVGATAMLVTLARIEEDARSNGIADAHGASADLEKAYRQFSEALQR